MALVGRMFSKSITGSQFTPTDAKSVAPYLKTELLVDLRSKQDAATALALSKPEEFMKQRSDLIRSFFDGATIVDGKITKFEDTDVGKGEVTKHFFTMYERYKKTGLPEVEARQYALDSARRMFAEEISILELEQPGAYKRAFGSAGITADSRDAKFDLSGIESEAIRKYKDRKRAKREAKK